MRFFPLKFNKPNCLKGPQKKTKNPKLFSCPPRNKSTTSSYFDTLYTRKERDTHTITEREEHARDTHVRIFFSRASG